MTCQARQFSDQMRCAACRLVWDKNDPEPPECNEGQPVGTARRTAPPVAAEALPGLPDRDKLTPTERALWDALTSSYDQWEKPNDPMFTNWLTRTWHALRLLRADDMQVKSF